VSLDRYQYGGFMITLSNSAIVLLIKVTNSSVLKKKIVLSTLNAVFKNYDRFAEKSYFSGRGLTSAEIESRKKLEKSVLFKSIDVLDDYPDCFDIGVRHFFPGNKTGSTEKLKKEYNVMKEIFLDYHVRTVYDLHICSPGDMARIDMELAKLNSFTPLAIMLIFRLCRE